MELGNLRDTLISLGINESFMTAWASKFYQACFAGDFHDLVKSIIENKSDHVRNRKYRRPGEAYFAVFVRGLSFQA
tara:strand:- start:1105 stop:1332 length:228 start_codon:yes stop_codon:yes gene_type:complete